MKRFWSKVNKNGPVVRDELGPCWLWTASLRHGYGAFGGWGNRHSVAAHRVSWEIHFGLIPPGAGSHGTCVCHKCDVRTCVNPSHLFLGTQRDNIRDMDAKGRDNRVRGVGELNGRKILTEVDVRCIREEYALGGISQKELGHKYGLSRSAVGYVVRGQHWSHL